jgi:hypothetical protein
VGFDYKRQRSFDIQSEEDRLLIEQTVRECIEILETLSEAYGAPYPETPIGLLKKHFHLE